MIRLRCFCFVQMCTLNAACTTNCKHNATITVCTSAQLKCHSIITALQNNKNTCVTHSLTHSRTLIWVNKLPLASTHVSVSHCILLLSRWGTRSHPYETRVSKINHKHVLAGKKPPKHDIINKDSLLIQAKCCSWSFDSTFLPMNCSKL